jgi:hypothetical protein
MNELKVLDAAKAVVAARQAGQGLEAALEALVAAVTYRPATRLTPDSRDTLEAVVDWYRQYTAVDDNKFGGEAGTVVSVTDLEDDELLEELVSAQVYRGTSLVPRPRADRLRRLAKELDRYAADSAPLDKETEEALTQLLRGLDAALGAERALAREGRGG